MTGIWAQHQYGIIFFLLAVLCICLANLCTFRRMSGFGAPRDFPLVSILIPARNEEENIVRCLESVLAQDYPCFEVVVLDDGSRDRTWEILSHLSSRDPRLRVIRGSEPPPGWTGKNWACHQLSLQAGGELLLFTDADTFHHPESLCRAVAALQESGADLLTALPRQEMLTPGEKMAVPILGWSVLCFFPLFLAHRLKAPFLSAAVGQFMLFRRSAYYRAGGHRAIRAEIADDFALARRIKSEGLNLEFLDGGDLLVCRMYRGLSSAFHGLTKSLFPAFGCRVILFVFVWTWLAVVFLEPPLVLAGGSLRWVRSESALLLAGIEVSLSLLLWSLAARRLVLGRAAIFLYPAVVALGTAAAITSLAKSLLGASIWKERTLPRPRPRWP
ncbi:glycosyltransferase [Candidatus Solincola tengchongensis]|uniref:glycosyltransferase n=1 Tax=Candidatus Solincola tengchongensis TaxID=2900693 RepID=UPI00257FA5F6|nr:glycosyltransferase [Candidatus Solincola tengchongensis]